MAIFAKHLDHCSARQEPPVKKTFGRKRFDKFRLFILALVLALPLPGTALFAQGEPSTGLYILHSGTGLLTMTTATGEPIFHAPLSPGMLLGLPGAIGNQPYSLTAIVFQGAKVSYIPREDFSQLMLREPSLSLHVLRVLAAEVRTARSALSQA